MSKIWKDIVEPPSTDYLWYRLNKYNGLVGVFEYKDSKWVLRKKKEEGSGEIDFSTLINGATENYDTLGELETAIKNVSNDRTFKEFKSSWPTSTTLEAFCAAMMSDTDVKVGNAYLGGLSCSGLPAGMGQGDVVIDVIGTNNNKVIRLTLTSTDVSPYHWEGCYWQGSFRGWKSFELQSNKVTSISNLSTDTDYPSAKAVYDNINPQVATTHPLNGFLPNVMYNLGELTGTITFALAAPTDANIVNHYYWTFDTTSTAPTITWPSGITWQDGSAPTVNASKHYEISILNNIGCYMEV